MKIHISIVLVLSAGLFAQAGRPAHFVNVSAKMNPSELQASRIASADVNNDGFPDLLIHQRVDYGQEGANAYALHLLLNKAVNKPEAENRKQRNAKNRKRKPDSARAFVDGTLESGLLERRQGGDEARRSSFGVFGDVNNDGNLDLFTGIYAYILDTYPDNGDRNDLYLGDGRGGFSPAVFSPFHQEPICNTSSAAFLDYDRDGHLDLFTGNFFASGFPSVSDFFPDGLYEGSGDGGFENVTVSSGLADFEPNQVKGTFAVSVSDWDNDGNPDLFSSVYCRDHSVQWQNDGESNFTQVQSVTGYGQYIGVETLCSSFYCQRTCGWGSVARDYDNDGDIDFFEVVLHGGEDIPDGPPHLEEIRSGILQNEAGVFELYPFFSDLRTDDPQPFHDGDVFAAWLDFDNDGLSDLVTSEAGYNNNRLYLYRQLRDHSFRLITPETALAEINTADLRVVAALPVDYDADGDEDLIVAIHGAPFQVWENRSSPQNRWITIELVGAGAAGKSNRNAIGARVEIETRGKTITREVYAGNGHFGPQLPLRINVGVGKAKRITELRILWPNAQLTTHCYRSLRTNRHYTFFE